MNIFFDLEKYVQPSPIQNKQEKSIECGKVTKKIFLFPNSLHWGKIW